MGINTSRFFGRARVRTAVIGEGPGALLRLRLMADMARACARSS
jgi:hypothetical protein